MDVIDPHRDSEIYALGEPLESAKAALVLIHGRGATAEDILGLGKQLAAPGFAYLAPQAIGYTWYPQSFLRPFEENEPYLTSALETVGRVMTMVLEAGIPADRTILAGFSQGACLASEYVARNAQRYGGLIAFSGGLIGPPGTPREYEGSLSGTPIFIGCSDVDSHIPKERVDESAEVFTRLGAVVDKRIYPGMAHTINRDELVAAQGMVAALLEPVPE